MPGDNRFRKRIGEVCLDLGILSETSDQWLIEVNKYFAVKPSQQLSQQMHSKTNFAILDNRGAVLTSLMKLTLQPEHFIQQQNINTTQLFSNNHFHFVDITKTKQDFLTSKYLAIHQYANHLGTINGQYHRKLTLIPLNVFGTRELVQEKFSAVPPDEVVIDHTRIGKHRRIGLVPQNLNQTKMNSESMSKYFHSLIHQESPWLECTTTKKISGIQLDVQDEYGKKLKSAMSNDILLNIIISFTDVPEEDI